MKNWSFVKKYLSFAAFTGFIWVLIGVIGMNNSHVLSEARLFWVGWFLFGSIVIVVGFNTVLVIHALKN